MAAPDDIDYRVIDANNIACCRKFRFHNYTTTCQAYVIWSLKSIYYPIYSLIFAMLLFTCFELALWCSILLGFSVIGLFVVLRMTARILYILPDETDLWGDFDSYWLNHGDDHKLFGAFVRGSQECIGCIGYFRKSSKDGRGVFELKRMWVQPAYRGRSFDVAKNFLKNIEKYIIHQLDPNALIDLITTNVQFAAMKFYPKHGYYGYAIECPVQVFPDCPFILWKFEKDLRSP